MAKPIECPSCLSMNKAGQVRCRVCGTRLAVPRERSAPSAPVTLQRVMSGEIFTAVVGEVPHEVEKAEPVETEEDLRQEEPAAPSASEENYRMLERLAQRLRQDAEAAEERFTPYRPTEPRKAESVDARKVAAEALALAVRAFKEQRFEATVQHLTKVLAKDESDPRVWNLLGASYLRLGRPYKAAVGFIRALELDIANGSAWLGLSRAFAAAGDSRGSLEVLDRTVQVAPDMPEAWLERGLILESLQNLSEAVKSFSNALRLKPDHPRARERYEALAAATAEELPSPKPNPTEREPAPAAAQPQEDKMTLEFDEFLGAGEGAPEPSARPPRICTHVVGLDDALGGGVPWGHVVLIQGAPGTMKSSIGFSILLNNAAKAGLHCLYISLEERAPSLLRQMASLGFNLHVERGSLVLLDPRSAKGILAEREDWIEAFEDALARVKAARGLDLVVIDSLEALEVLARFQDRRRDMFRLFEWLRDLGVTSFLITERPDWVVGGHVLQGRWDEDFLADGVFHLRQHLVSDLEVQRRLRVVKMRGTPHESGYLALVLDDGRFRVTRAMTS